MSAATIPKEQIQSQIGEPTWEVAQYFPTQGDWSEEEYLVLDEMGGRHVELNNGILEFPPMPGYVHQFLLLFLCDYLRDYLKEFHEEGTVLPAPFPVRLAPNLLREPDVVFLRPERMKNRPAPPDGADLLMEIVSAGNEAQKRDFTTKRNEYAAADVPEYWIVDPKNHVVHVLTLDDGRYREHGVFKKGQTITSGLFHNLTLDVDELFAGERGTP